MKKNSKKTISLTLILLLGAVLLMVFAVKYIQLHGELHYSKDPYIDTIFTKGFTVDKFNSISKGMTEQEVIAILREPFEKDITGSSQTYKVDKNSFEIPKPDWKRKCWSYSTDGKLGNKGDTSWYSYVVCFRDHKVEDLVVNEFFD